MTLIKRHLYFVLFLMVLPAVLVPETIFQGKQLAQHDILQWRAGAESLIQHEKETGEQALWDTNMFGGMPAYVISNIKGFTSLDTLVNRYGYIIFPYVYYLFLLIGAYVFFLSLGASPFAATFGAVIVGFSTYIPIIIGAGHNTKFYAYVWTPWLLTGFRMLMQRKWLTGFAVFTFFLSLQIRSGHPQVTYYFLFLMGVWWLSEAIVAFKSKETRPLFIQTGLMVGAAMVVILSVLPQYWALYEYADYSIRGGSALSAEGGLNQNYAFVWSQGWGELLTLLIPNLYGGGELYWGPKPVTSGPHYFGAIAGLFLVMGLIGKKDRLDWVFISAGSLAILFSLGNHFSLLNDAMFAWFPGFNKFRTPEMWLMMTCVAFAVPAVRAFDRTPSLKTVYVGGGSLLLFGLIVLLSFGNLTDYEKAGERRQYQQQIGQSNNVSPDDPRVVQAVNNYMTQAKSAREAATRSDTLRFMLFVILASGTLHFVVKKKLKAEYAFIGLIALTSFDMVATGKRYIPDAAFQDRIGDVGNVIEAGRRDIDTWLQENVKTGEGWSYRVLPVADNPFNNAVPSYFYPSIGGYSGAKLSVLQDVVDRSLFSGAMGLNTHMLNTLNVKFVTLGYPGEIPGFTRVHESDQIFVFENTSVKPKAWFADSLITVKTPQAAMDAINSTSTTVVETSDEIEAGSGEGTITITDYDAHRIELKTESSDAQFLVLSEIYYPAGWSAFLNGEVTQIYKTNYLLRGIELPAGNHTVEFRFEPTWLSGAKTTSLLANWFIFGLVLVAGVVVVRKR